MRFPPEDSKLLVSKNPSFSKAIMEISEICTICNIGHQWIKDEELIAGLAIFSHIDEQNLDAIVTIITSLTSDVLSSLLEKLSETTKEQNPSNSPQGANAEEIQQQLNLSKQL